MAEDKKRRGRPTKYLPEFADQARKLCLLGATDDELAAFFGVTQRSINGWKGTHPDFFQSLKDGKVSADAHIADRLRNRAEGFEWDEDQPIKVKEVTYENGKRLKEIERVEIVTVHKVVPPDTTAGIFWLKNRRSRNWRDKTEADVNLRTTKDVLDELDAEDRQEVATAAEQHLKALDGPTVKE